MKIVYIISSIIHDDRIYIGSTINFNKRISSHINDLKANRHHSITLQRHFNLYGIDDIYFYIVEELKQEDNMCEIEQFYIDNLKPFFNTSTFAVDLSNRNHNRAAWNKGMTNLPKQEKSRIDHRVHKATISKYKPISQFDLYGNLINNWESTKAAANFLDVDEANISQCLTGRNKTAYKFIWKYL